MQQSETPAPAAKRKRSRLEVFFISFFALSFVSLAGFIFIFMKYGVDLPDYAKLAEYRPPVTSRFYAGDGSLLTEYATEKRIFVPLKDIPPNLINAFVSAEDKNFWTHGGIDLTGIFRASITNIKRKIFGGAFGGGASTITQQVAKNFFLSSESTFTRKIKEAILALKMERTFSKRHILTLYMNQIFLGYRSYGVAAAALNYFGKSLPELTLSESAFLAALPKAPSNYNPLTNRDRALARRNWVLERMEENGYIDAKESDSAKAEDITVNESLMTRPQRYALYFSEEVRKSLADVYGEEQLYSGGLAVRTTINPRYQELATKSLRRALVEYDVKQGWRGATENVVDTLEGDNWPALVRRAPVVSGMEDDGWKKAVVLDAAKIGLANGETGELSKASLDWTRGNLKTGDIVFVQKNSDGSYALRQVPELGGAMVVMDPHTGRVFALVGGFSYWHSKFNRATQALRQPGSTIKPFVYLSALMTGKYTPVSILLDAPIVMDKEDGEQWRPENYDDVFEGEITLRRAVEKSKNIPTVRVVLDIGLRAFIKTALDFGVYRNVKNPNLSMALGSGDTKLLDLTTAFSRLINGGRRVDAVIVDRVQDRSGRTVYRNDARACEGCSAAGYVEGTEPPVIPDTREQLADPVAVYQIVNIMQGVVDRGSGWKARIPGRTIGGKTGTSNEQKDVWFVGGTPDLVVGVFLGFDQPKSLGSYAAGGSLAAPVFKEFMEQALEGQRDVAFRVPAGVSFVRINRNTGKLATPADPAFDTILEAFKEGTEDTVRPTVPAVEGDGARPAETNLDGIY
ncbi:MAG: penicillin-binding protein 1A [Rickettsiales bacterium]|jgi:penicillin-binding protein 1A|nr:penicillin-binding protein 1A [Rickettsiales bacterium]